MGGWRLWIIVALVIVLAIVGALAYLAYGDFPVPTKPVEKVLPNDRFPR
jgi:hypothetical protein